MPATKQLSLFRQKLDAFCEFHAANRNVYELFVRFAREAKQSGRERFGARLIAERIRWYYRVEHPTDSEFVLNDHHTPFYSRLVMARNEDLVGIFERRDARFECDDVELLRAVSRAENT